MLANPLEFSLLGLLSSVLDTSISPPAPQTTGLLLGVGLGRRLLGAQGSMAARVWKLTFAFRFGGLWGRLFLMWYLTPFQRALRSHLPFECTFQLLRMTPIHRGPLRYWKLAGRVHRMGSISVGRGRRFWVRFAPIRFEALKGALRFGELYTAQAQLRALPPRRNQPQPLVTLKRAFNPSLAGQLLCYPKPAASQDTRTPTIPKTQPFLARVGRQPQANALLGLCGLAAEADSLGAHRPLDWKTKTFGSPSGLEYLFSPSPSHLFLLRRLLRGLERRSGRFRKPWFQKSVWLFGGLQWLCWPFKITLCKAYVGWFESAPWNRPRRSLSQACSWRRLYTIGLLLYPPWLTSPSATLQYWALLKPRRLVQWIRLWFPDFGPPANTGLATLLDILWFQPLLWAWFGGFCAFQPLLAPIIQGVIVLGVLVPLLGARLGHTLTGFGRWTVIDRLVDRLLDFSNLSVSSALALDRIGQWGWCALAPEKFCRLALLGLAMGLGWPSIFQGAPKRRSDPRILRLLYRLFLVRRLREVWPAQRPPCPLLEVLDVGQGLAVLLRQGEHGLMFDTADAIGPRSVASCEILPYLDRLALKLDAVFLSHKDRDHTGGLADVRQAFPDTRVIAPFRAPGVTQLCQSGAAWNWRGWRLEALWPQQAQKVGENPYSLVLLCLPHHGPAALLTGDLTRKAEAAFLETVPPEAAQALKRPRILQLAHHGSRHSSGFAFLRWYAPYLTLSSQGTGDRFPHPELLGRLSALKLPHFGTARFGKLSCCLKAGEALGPPHTLHSPWWETPDFWI